MSFVALEDSTDEVAVTRRHCRSLLVKLGSMVSDTDLRTYVHTYHKSATYVRTYILTHEL